MKKMNLNLEKFKKIKKEMNDSSSKIKELKGETVKVIKGSSIFLNQIRRIESQYNFANSAINDVPEGLVKKMNPQEYNQQIQPFEDMAISAGSFAPMLSGIKGIKDNLNLYTGTASALTSTTSTSTSTVYINVNNSNIIYPHGNTYKTSFEREEELQEDIEMIKKELPKITPDISKDFQSFLSKYYGFKDNGSRYQELIGFRSTMFLKLIFGFAIANGIKIEKEGGNNTRKDQISFFTINNIHPSPIHRPQIDIAKNLYDEMSNQNTDGDSIKKGKVSDEYVSALFRRCISVLASLLKIRKNYYS